MTCPAGRNTKQTSLPEDSHLRYQCDNVETPLGCMFSVPEVSLRSPPRNPSHLLVKSGSGPLTATGAGWHISREPMGRAGTQDRTESWAAAELSGPRHLPFTLCRHPPVSCVPGALRHPCWTGSLCPAAGAGARGQRGGSGRRASRHRHPHTPSVETELSVHRQYCPRTALPTGVPEPLMGSMKSTPFEDINHSTPGLTPVPMCKPCRCPK